MSAASKTCATCKHWQGDREELERGKCDELAEVLHYYNDDWRYQPGGIYQSPYDFGCNRWGTTR